jgi:hypothetical protein
MQFLTSPAAGPSAIMFFLAQHGATLPAHTLDHLSAYVPSGVVRIVTAAEALYAAADDLTEAGWTLCAQLARIAEDNAFHVQADQPDRWAGIIAAMRRRVGETTGPDPSEDPAPLAQYLPPTE